MNGCRGETCPADSGDIDPVSVFPLAAHPSLAPMAAPSSLASPAMDPRPQRPPQQFTRTRFSILPPSAID